MVGWEAAEAMKKGSRVFEIKVVPHDGWLITDDQWADLVKALADAVTLWGARNPGIAPFHVGITQRTFTAEIVNTRVY